MTTSQDLLEQHLNALQSGNIDALMSHYSDDAVLIYIFGTARGTDEIRQVFTTFLSDIIPPESTTLTIETKYIEGDIAYIVWHAESDTHNIPFSTDTFILKNSKIIAQTSAGRIDTK